MPAERDPLSERFDTATRRALNEARRKAPPRTADRFVASPPREFRDLDKGGRTAHERAFQRSAYYLIFKVPRNDGVPPAWSLKITWGKIERHGGRWGRRVRLRLFPYGRGYRKVLRNHETSYAEHEYLRARPGQIGGAG